MQLRSTTNTETNCMLDKKTFNIESSPIAFEILSSKLYSNPQLAVIREIMTNAYDAHVVANTLDIPIDVDLPTIINHTLRIRDYGTGLSEDDIMNLYTTFFASDKRDDNILTGGFGLGSKAPFAYTSNFSVISYYNNKQTTYALLIINKLPNVIKTHEDYTEEPNGLELIIPTKQEDAFYIRNLFTEFINYNPEIKVKTNIELELHPHVYKQDNITIYKRQRYESYVYIKQGQNIFYCNQALFKQDNQNIFNNTDVIIEVPIGTVDIPPSREDLQYTDKTIKALSGFKDKLIDIAYKMSEDAKLYSFVNSRISNIVRNNAVSKIIKNDKFISKYIDLSNVSFNPHTSSFLDYIKNYVNIYKVTFNRKLKKDNYLNGTVLFDYPLNLSKERKIAELFPELTVFIEPLPHVSKQEYYAIIKVIELSNKFANTNFFTLHRYRNFKKELGLSDDEINETSLLNKTILAQEYQLKYSLGIYNKFARTRIKDLLEVLNRKEAMLFITQTEFKKAYKSLNFFYKLRNNYFGKNLLKDLTNYFNKFSLGSISNTDLGISVIVVKDSNKRLIERALKARFIEAAPIKTIYKKHVKPYIYSGNMKPLFYMSGYKTIFSDIMNQLKEYHDNLISSNKRYSLYMSLFNKIHEQIYFRDLIYEFYSNDEIIYYSDTNSLKRLHERVSNIINYANSCFNSQRLKRSDRLKIINKLISRDNFKHINL